MGHDPKKILGLCSLKSEQGQCNWTKEKADTLVPFLGGQTDTSTQDGVETGSRLLSTFLLLAS